MPGNVSQMRSLVTVKLTVKVVGTPIVAVLVFLALLGGRFVVAVGGCEDARPVLDDELDHGQVVTRGRAVQGGPETHTHAHRSAPTQLTRKEINTHTHTHTHGSAPTQLTRREREREFFYLTTHSTHFIYGYMASDIWLRTILIVRKETRCRHIGYSYRLTARVLLYAPSHRQDNTYHGLCYTSCGALAGTRNSSMGPPHEGSIQRTLNGADINTNHFSNNKSRKTAP